MFEKETEHPRPCDCIHKETVEYLNLRVEALEKEISRLTKLS